MNELARFIATMEYGTPDRVPNHELGIWPQCIERWKNEGMPEDTLTSAWFVSEDYFGLDHREYVPLNGWMMPAFEPKVIEKTDRYEIIQHSSGVVTKALIDGTVSGGRMCMDQYLRFPVENMSDFQDMKKRFDPKTPERYDSNWKDEIVPKLKNRTCPLSFCNNCAIGGFYWRAREWMGTENASYAWYDQPELMHEMMEFYADFTIELMKPILSEVDCEYLNFNEDFAMKNGPLLSPGTFKEFIFPHMKRVIGFAKSNGVKYVSLDSDGNPEPLVPLLMDAGVDILWPLERASDMDPVRIRKKFGKTLKLWGGVDKREIAKGPEAIDAHLRELIPLIEEGGYIPTVDHTVPPDVSWDNLCYYFDSKRKLLEGKL